MAFNNQDIIYGAIIGQFTVLIGKIIWDWLQNKRQPAQAQSCGSCNDLKQKISKCENCLMSLKQKTERHETLIDEHQKAIAERLKEGSILMTKLQTDVSSIKENIAVLLDRSNERRKTDNALSG